MTFRMRFVMFFCIALLSAASAAEETAVDAPAISAYPTAIARGEFADAIELAKALGEQRWAFTASFEDLAERPGRVLRARFDPRKPAGERWSMLGGEKLSKDEKKAFERLTRNDQADDPLVYERLGDVVESAIPISVTRETAVFRLQVDDPKMPAEVRDALEATATFDRIAKHVTDITILSVKSFKPAPVAKVDMMRQVQRYAPVGPDGAVLMTASESLAKGSAMLKKFDSNTRILYSDFEKVDAEPFRRENGKNGR